MSDPESIQLLTLLYHTVRSSHHTTQCGLLVLSPTPIYTSPLTFPILTISLYSLPVTAQPGNPTSLTSLSIAHTALTLDSGSSLVKFVMVPGVVEEMELPSGMLEVVWQELETGMKIGIQAEMIIHGQHNVLFASDDSTVDVA